MIPIRAVQVLKNCQPPLAALWSTDQVRGLKIHPSNPPPGVTLPKLKNLPVLPKVPTVYANHMGKIPKGTKETYRMLGEEKVHTDLLLGQFGIVAVHGGAIKHSTLETIRNYTGRKLKKGQSFAFYRVDAPYKVCLEIRKNLKRV